MKRPSALRRLVSTLGSQAQLLVGFAGGTIAFATDMISSGGWWLVLKSSGWVVLAGSLSWTLVKTHRTDRLVQGKKPFPILIAIGRPRSESIRALPLLQSAVTKQSGFKDFSAVEQQFNVKYEEMFVHRAEQLPPNPTAWHDFLGEAQQELRPFLQRISGERVYHVAIQGPASLAIGLGAVFGTRSPVVAYHYTADAYLPVLNLTQDTRQVKTYLPADAFTHITVAYPLTVGSDTAVVLDMAGHNPIGDTKDYLAKQMAGTPLVEVRNTYGGNLTEADWAPVVQEIFAAINTLQRNQDIQRIHLFHSMPVPLAFGLGMALGYFADITVYNWEREQSTYFPVLHLNHIHSLL